MASESHCSNPGHLTLGSVGSPKSNILFSLKRTAVTGELLLLFSSREECLALSCLEGAQMTTSTVISFCSFTFQKLSVNRECFSSTFSVPSAVSDSKPFLLPLPSLPHSGFSAGYTLQGLCALPVSTRQQRTDFMSRHGPPSQRVSVNSSLF